MLSNLGKNLLESKMSILIRSISLIFQDEVATMGFYDCGYIATVIFALISYISPIAIVIIPRLWLVSGPASSDCGTSCKVRYLEILD